MRVKRTLYEEKLDSHCQVLILNKSGAFNKAVVVKQTNKQNRTKIERKNSQYLLFQK